VINAVIQKTTVTGIKSSFGEVILNKFIKGFANSRLKKRSGETSTAKKGTTDPNENSSAKEAKNIKITINASWPRRFLLIWTQNPDIKIK
jgi:hypothetical protein